MTAKVVGGKRPFVVAGFGEGEKVCWERPLVKGKVMDGKRPLVVAGFGECEKVGGERPLVGAKVVDGKRPLRLRSVQAVFHYNVRH